MSVCSGDDPDNLMPDTMDPLEINIPSEGLLHNYYYIYSGKGVWKYWPDMLRSTEIEETINLQQTLVPTVETAKWVWVPLQLAKKVDTNILLILRNKILSEHWEFVANSTLFIWAVNGWLSY